LKSYTAGVNTGLRTLRAPPPEYLVLRSRPGEWRLEDTILIAFNLYRLLQDQRADQDFNRHQLYAALPQPICDFLAPEGCPDWDTPLIGKASAEVSIPGPETFDFRFNSPERIPDLRLPSIQLAGSNAWAISGKHTKDGRAIVANDIHLPFGMPSIFFRARLDFDERGPRHCLSGITIPGFPFLLAGTNGDIAWGLANAALDAVNLVQLDQDGLPQTSYHAAGSVQHLEFEREVLHVRGGPDEEVIVRKTRWGPVTRRNSNGESFAQRWLAYRAGAVNLGWRELETATSVGEAMTAANRIGAPALAMVVADGRGEVGWTLAGLLPRVQSRRGSGHPRLPPLSSEIIDERIDSPFQSPQFRSPEFSRVWAANARPILTGPFAELVGGGYHSCGARAKQIRDSIMGLDLADEELLWRIQCDDRALFYARWGALLIEVLQSLRHARSPEALDSLRSWDGRAAADSVAYRLVREFRDVVQSLVFEPFISLVRTKQGQFDISQVTDQLEAPLWRLISEKPVHLLPPWFADWDALITNGALQVLDTIPQNEGLHHFVWGAVNRLNMRHVLSPFVPLFGRLFDAPCAPLDGDLHMPLAQTPGHGPVCRFVVSPGNDQLGIAQMAGGQASNPLAPYYLAGHDDWLERRLTSFDPGPPRYRLTINPQ
jgi:penicillin amidase